MSAATATTEALLEVRGLEASYGRTQILFGLDLDVHQGELVALLGTNGAGKSTLFKAITGLLPPQAGTVRFQERTLNGLPTEEIAARGVVMMPGGRSVFPTLTVTENLLLASWLKHHDKAAVAEAEERVLTLLPRLKERLDVLAGNLSGGEQQMLAVAQALIPDPQILLIDELSLGLAPTVVGQLVEVIQAAHATGLTIVVVEQSVNVALRLAERAVFMEKGTFRFTGPTADLLARPDLLRSVFIEGDPNARGPKTNGDRSPKPETGSPTVLECRNVTKRFGALTAVNDVELSVREREIVGLIGQNGAGKTTLLDCVSGFLAIDGGRIFFKGEDITELRPHQRALRGLGRTFQEARLFPTLTTAETIAVARERHVLSRSLLGDVFAQPIADAAADDTEAAVERVLDMLHLQGFRDRLTSELSTGTRRIVELACLLTSDPEVIVLDEPSAGVAQREAEALGPLLKRIRDATSASILIIEHDMPLLAALCDTMYALEIGAVIAHGTPAEVLAHPAVVESYLGTDTAVINRSGTLRGRRKK